jgi:hypothetical protein
MEKWSLRECRGQKRLSGELKVKNKNVAIINLSNNEYRIKSLYKKAKPELFY